MRKIAFVLILILCVAGLARAQQNRVLTAASATCTTASCLTVTVDPTQGGATLTVSANTSGNTINFEASGDGGKTVVAISATPSNSSTSATLTTSTGVWQINTSGYTNIYLRMSNLVSGTSTVSIVQGNPSARGGSGGGGGGTVTGSGAPSQVAFWSSPTALSGSSKFTWADGVNAEGINVGPPASIASTLPLGVFGSPVASFDSFIQSNFLYAGGLGVSQINLLNTDTSTPLSSFVAQNITVQDDGPDGKFDIGIQMGIELNQAADQGDSGVIGQESLVYLTGAGGIGGGVIANQAGVIDNDSGTNSPGGFIAYQANSDINSGTATSLTQFDSFAGVNGGVLTTLTNFRAQTPFGVGSATTAYGFYAAPQKATNKWAFYAVSDPSFFGGGFWIENVAVSSTVPTISGAGCGGSGASISSHNGTAAFRVAVGTSNTGTCTITMPAATTGWNCEATNLTTKSTNQATVLETSASGTTTLVLQNYTDVMITHAMTDADSLSVTCTAD